MPLLVDVRQLRVINELIGDGAAGVAESFGTLAGVETAIDINSLAFVDPSDLPAEVGSGEVYAATIDLTEPPYGSFMLTFSEATASTVVELVAGHPVEGDFTSIHESALRETCNICTSGFIDEFANALDTTIDMGTPELNHTDGGDLLHSHLSHVRSESIAVVLDSTIRVPERNERLELNVYLVPAPGAFVNLLDCMDPDVGDEQPADEGPS